MVTSLTYIFPISILLSHFTGSLGIDNATERFTEAKAVAYDVLGIFFDLFQGCVKSTMGDKNFIIDNLQAFLFYPAKTTVGYAPKFTSNRKFFAHLIGTTEFHHMMKKDLADLRASYVDKLKFCDHTMMDEAMLQDFYDKEFLGSSNLK